MFFKEWSLLKIQYDKSCSILGNFVSAQRTRKRDGDAILKITVKKDKNNCVISDCNYYLTWVNQSIVDNKKVLRFYFVMIKMKN